MELILQAMLIEPVQGERKRSRGSLIGNEESVRLRKRIDLTKHTRQDVSKAGKRIKSWEVALGAGQWV